jgi:hypothetical protein
VGLEIFGRFSPNLQRLATVHQADSGLALPASEIAIMILAMEVFLKGTSYPTSAR